MRWDGFACLVLSALCGLLLSGCFPLVANASAKRDETGIIGEVVTQVSIVYIATENHSLSEETDFDYTEAAEEYLDLDEIETALSELLGTDTFSFRDTVAELLAGEIHFSWELISETLSGLLLGEWKQQKQLVVQILLVAFASAVFTNFLRVFDSQQIAEISFYMTYLVVSALL
ncbi:MAG: stage III sporulation protein AE, partial [Lachnospiraceae bacterium]|nr:stage III sporulation protein AE [Lachnospiraceae bacterium]